MPPPPRPVARGRRRTAAARNPDPALDDIELDAARAALSQGRWQAARSLLAHTGEDWDRRAHRVTVLALEPYAAAFAHDWLLAEPGCADARVLHALAQVRRVQRGKENPSVAREECRTATELAPADPTPWLGLLMLDPPPGRDGGVEAVRIFEEVRARHRDHRCPPSDGRPARRAPRRGRS